MFTQTPLIDQECLIVLIGDFAQSCEAGIGCHLPDVDAVPRSGKETAATDQSSGGEQAFLFGDVNRQCVHQVR